MKKIRYLGFSLLEMVIVVIIMGILLSTLVPMFDTKKVKAKTAEKFANRILEIYNAEKNFYMNEYQDNNGKAVHYFGTFKQLHDKGYYPGSTNVKDPFYGENVTVTPDNTGKPSFTIKFYVPKDVVGIIYNSLPGAIGLKKLSGNKYEVTVKGTVPGLAASFDNLMHRDANVNQELRTSHGPIQITDNVNPGDSKLYITDDNSKTPEQIKNSGYKVSTGKGILLVGSLDKEGTKYGIVGSKGHKLYINSNDNSGNGGELYIGNDDTSADSGSLRVSIGVKDKELLGTILSETADNKTAGIYISNNKASEPGKNIIASTTEITDKNGNKYKDMTLYSYADKQYVKFQTSDKGTNLISSNIGDVTANQGAAFNVAQKYQGDKSETAFNIIGAGKEAQITKSSYIQNNGYVTGTSSTISGSTATKQYGINKVTSLRGIPYKLKNMLYDEGQKTLSSYNMEFININNDVKNIDTKFGYYNSDGTTVAPILAMETTMDKNKGGNRRIAFGTYDKNGKYVVRYISMDDPGKPVISFLNSIAKIKYVTAGDTLERYNGECAGGQGVWRWQILGVKSEFLSNKSYSTNPDVKILNYFKYSSVVSHPLTPSKENKNDYYPINVVLDQLMKNQTYLQAMEEVLARGINQPTNGTYQTGNGFWGKLPNTIREVAIFALVQHIDKVFQEFWKKVQDNFDAFKDFAVFMPWGLSVDENGKFHNLKGYIVDYIDENKYIRAKDFIIKAFIQKLPDNLLGFYNYLVKDPDDKNKLIVFCGAKLYKHNYRIVNENNKDLIKKLEEEGWTKVPGGEFQMPIGTTKDKSGNDKIVYTTFYIYQSQESGFYYLPDNITPENSANFAKTIKEYLQGNKDNYPIYCTLKVGLVCMPKPKDWNYDNIPWIN